MNKIYRTVIIDDEESAIDNLCLALKPYGQIVVEGVAHNGAAGLKLIEKVRPDLVFQDVELPDMLGMELVTRARKKLGVNMEVVFYTAYISPKTKCNPFSKRFVQFSLLLAQNEM